MPDALRRPAAPHAAALADPPVPAPSGSAPTRGPAGGAGRRALPRRSGRLLAATPLRRVLACAAVLSAMAAPAAANQVEIVDASARRSGDGWSFSVTLRHADEGWDHYADAWRVLGPGGKVLGMRTLFHPHVNEQPFTRSLSGVAIPMEVKEVTIEARDTVHGWSPATFTLPLPTR